MISKDEKDCALFINYHKEENISASTKYHDRFISRNEFVWMSKSGRTFKSNCVSKILAQNKSNMRIPLFVKKKNLEGIEFYYLGNSQVQKETAVEKLILNDEGKNISVVEMNFNLISPVEKSLYDYLLHSN